MSQEIIYLNSASEFKHWHPQWNALYAHCPHATVYQKSLWIQNYLESFASHSHYHPLIALLVNKDKELLAAAALEVTENRGVLRHYRTLGFLGTKNYLCDYAEPLYRSPATCVELLNAILQQTSHKHIEFRNLRSSSTSYNILCSVLPDYQLTHSPYSAPGIQFDTDQKVLSSLLKKKSLKRHHNYFARNGGLLLEAVNDSNIDFHLQTFYAQHIKRWKIKGIESPLIQSDQKHYFASLAHESLKDRSFVHFDVLLNDNNPIAYHLGFLEKKHFYWYKSSFDVALSKHSPGEALLYKLFEKYAAFADYFDFTIGDEAFKSRFANQSQEISWLECDHAPIYRNGKLLLSKLKKFVKKVVR